MRTVKLVIGFQGTNYEGWQSQKKGNTVQEIVEKHLARILKAKTSLIGSSRTDSGVHAEALVAHFKTASPLSDNTIKKALNYYLPRDILIRSAKTVPAGFHARYSAKHKIYRYDIWNSPTRPLFEAPFVLWYPNRLDIRRMRQAARFLVGKHDFRAFTDDSDKESTVRTVQRLRLTKKAPLVSLEIQANGFLRHMVRVVAGTLIEVGRGKIAPQDVKAILTARDRKKAGPTARALGLRLLKVVY